MITNQSALHQLHLNQAIWLSGGLLSTAAMAQDAEQGAMLYMRLANNVASCASCHGPDPSLNHNNILRSANNPATLVKVINTTSRMGYLSAELSEIDTRDVTAFLGYVTNTDAQTSALRVWPWTIDFGYVPPSQDSAQQFVRISNPSRTSPLRIDAIAANSQKVVLTHSCPAVLPAGAVCDVNMALQPGVTGLHRAALKVVAGGQTAVTGISGYGATSPVSRLTWGSAGTVMLSTPQGSLARTTLTMSNPGPMPAVLGATSITGAQANQFQIESGCGNGTVVQAGTSCNLTVSYGANLIAQSFAVLQLRSDQTNPPSLLLQGTSTPAPNPDQATTPPAGGGSGGGCAYTSDPAQTRDPTLMAAVFAAAAVLIGRRKRFFPAR